MTVPNPAAHPVASRAVPQQSHPQPHRQADWVPPLRDPEPPKPPRPPLTQAAASRARVAGGVGGGIAWAGLGIAQAAVTLLALPALVAAVVYGIGFTVSDGSASATGTVVPQLLDWLASPLAIALIAGIPLGVVVWLLGLFISASMLRRSGLARPVGVTWAGFGIAVVASAILGSVGSFTFSPFVAGFPWFAIPDLDIDARGGSGWSSGDSVDIDPAVLERFADPAQLLAIASPWVALGTLASLILPVVISIFTWWWMAHALRARPIEMEPEATQAA